MIARSRGVCRAGKNGLCHPCSRTEGARGLGGYSAVLGHGALNARVLQGGFIAVGDSVECLGPTEPGSPAAGTKNKTAPDNRGGQHHTTEEERPNGMNHSLVALSYRSTQGTAVMLVTIILQGH
jgi:MOSC domain-containing protein YiiM